MDPDQGDLISTAPMQPSQGQHGCLWMIARARWLTEYVFVSVKSGRDAERQSLELFWGPSEFA